MIEELDDTTLRTLMTGAWMPGEGCKEAARLLDALVHDPTPGLRQEVARHLLLCVVCQADPVHASALLADRAELDANAADLDFIGGRVDTRLRGMAQEQALPSNVIPLRPRLVPWIPMALAATVLLAVGLTLGPGAPDVPAPPTGHVARGGHIDALAPVDDVVDAPAELSWVALAGAGISYEVRLERPDGQVLWTGRSAEARVALPQEVRAALEPATAYIWRVEARRGEDVVAMSEGTLFRMGRR